MRKLFPGHYKPSAEEFAELWTQAVFSFDANILLNLYRYTDDSRAEVIEVMKRLSDRVWLTHQSAYEYHDNRPDVVSAQQRLYVDLEEIIEKAIAEIDKRFRRQSLFHETIVSRDITEALRSVINDVKRRRETHRDYSADDPVQDFLATFFDGKVGLPFPPDVYEQRCKDAAKRFERRVAPGFEDDGDKRKPHDKKYGDVLIWFQLLDYAKEIKKPVIFLTDDAKDDWWLRISGKTIGPLPELIDEFMRETGMRFYMYSTGTFLEHARNQLKITVNQNAIDEVKAVGRRRSINEDQLLQLVKAASRRPHILDGLNDREVAQFLQIIDTLLARDSRLPGVTAIADKDLRRIRSLSKRIRTSPRAQQRPMPGKDGLDGRRLKRILRTVAGFDVPGEEAYGDAASDAQDTD